MNNLITFPNPVLTDISTEWDFNIDKDAELIENEMISIMQYHNGIGLAGNQIGLIKRVFVMFSKDQNKNIGVFNPKVLWYGNEITTENEGCLSFPHLYLPIKRPLNIEVEYLDKVGERCIIKLSDIDARCFLHELDHLNGICFTEHVSQLKLMLAKKKQIKIHRKYSYNG